MTFFPRRRRPRAVAVPPPRDWVKIIAATIAGLSLLLNMYQYAAAEASQKREIAAREREATQLKSQRVFDSFFRATPLIRRVDSLRSVGSGDPGGDAHEMGNVIFQVKQCVAGGFCDATLARELFCRPAVMAIELGKGNIVDLHNDPSAANLSHVQFGLECYPDFYLEWPFIPSSLPELAFMFGDTLRLRWMREYPFPEMVSFDSAAGCPSQCSY